MQPLIYATGMARVVWAGVISFELQPQIHKNYSGAHIQCMHRVMLKHSHVAEQNWYALHSSGLQVQAEFTETCPLATCCLVSLSFEAGIDATVLNYMCLGVCGSLQSLVFQCRLQLSKFLQWHSSVCICVCVVCLFLFVIFGGGGGGNFN